MSKLAVFQIAGVCPKKLPAGTEIDIYLTCSCELTGFPKTEAVLNAGVNPGDAVTLAENFDFTAAAVGAGYWRKYQAIVDKNKIDVAKIGEEGSEALSSGISFSIAGTSAVEVEFAECIVALSGCLIAMIRPRGSLLMEGIGTKSLPATVDTLTLDGGEKAGDTNYGAYRLKYDGTPWFINDTTFPIDVTPN